MEKISSYEYAAFAWNKRKRKYQMVGKPTLTEMLARKRFEEKARNGWLESEIDAGNVVIRKRYVYVMLGEWRKTKDGE